MTPLRFLFLEDNLLDAEVVQVTLISGGIDCELLRVDTCDDFINALETNTFDAILADYSLPGFDGLAALRLAHNLAPNTPFIFVSGSLGEELAIEALKYGATDYVLKQRLARLVPSVHRALREAEERSRRQQAEIALQESQANLVAELVDTKRLQHISSQLVQADNINLLYEQILDAAIAFMHSDMGSLQMCSLGSNELQLLVWRNFHPEAAEFWERVNVNSGSVCSAALQRREQIIVDNIELCDFLSETDRNFYNLSKICAVQSTPLVSRSGSLVGMLSTHWRQPHHPSERELRLLDLLARQAADLIERKQAEGEREQLLQREKAARAEAEQANRTKDEFLAVLSHELRTPLNPILGWAKLLRNQNLDAEQTAQALATIEQNAKLQSELVDNLLDISRIIQGRLNLKITPLDLATIVRSAIKTLELAAAAKSIHIEMDFELQVGQISGDPTRLQQVVWNLLSNAIKFTPAQGQIHIRLEQVDNQAQLIIRDNGIGISPSFLPNVFDYFRQADSSTTRRFGGLGLGLAIVRHLVELHGGTVAAESAGEGLGATFSVKLPLIAAQSATELDSILATEPPPDLSGIQVLAVDDEADSLSLVTFILQQAGARVITATSAREGLQIFTQSPPDILLSDIGMLEMDGYMLIQQIRALPPEQGGQVKAIAVTAFAGDSNRRKALQAGFHEHICKPVEPKALVKAVNTLVKS